MTKISAEIEDILWKKFRMKVLEKRDKLRGELSNALEEAIILWLGFQEQGKKFLEEVRASGEQKLQDMLTKEKKK